MIASRSRNVRPGVSLIVGWENIYFSLFDRKYAALSCGDLHRICSLAILAPLEGNEVASRDGSKCGIFCFAHFHDGRDRIDRGLRRKPGR